VIDGGRRRRPQGDPARIDHNRLLRQAQDGRQVVADEKDGAPLLGHGVHLAQAFALELGVAHRQDLIHDQDLRIEVGRGLEGPIPDVVAKRVIREVIAPHFLNGDFNGGIVNGTAALMKLIEGEPLPVPNQQAAGPSSSADLEGLFAPLLVATVLMGAFLSKVLGRFFGAAVTELYPNAHTAASGLRVPKPLGDYIILKVLRESGGTAVAVTDEEMVQAQREMAEAQGILAAPEGAATWAGLKKLKVQGWVTGRERILLYNTGSGVLYPELLPVDAPVLDPNDAHALDAVR